MSCRSLTKSLICAACTLQDFNVDPGAFQSPWSYGRTDGGFAFCLSAKRVTTAYLITASNRRQMPADEHFLSKNVISLTSKNKMFAMDIIDIYIINIHKKLWQLRAVFLHICFCVFHDLQVPRNLGQSDPWPVVRRLSSKASRRSWVPLAEATSCLAVTDRPDEDSWSWTPWSFDQPPCFGGENIGRTPRPKREIYIVLQLYISKFQVLFLLLVLGSVHFCVM